MIQYAIKYGSALHGDGVSQRVRLNRDRRQIEVLMHFDFGEWNFSRMWANHVEMPIFVILSVIPFLSVNSLSLKWTDMRTDAQPTTTEQTSIKRRLQLPRM